VLNSATASRLRTTKQRHAEAWCLQRFHTVHCDQMSLSQVDLTTQVILCYLKISTLKEKIAFVVLDFKSRPLRGWIFSGATSDARLHFIHLSSRRRMRWYTLFWAMIASAHVLVNDSPLFPFGSIQNQLIQLLKWQMKQQNVRRKPEFNLY
jgi:5-carboxymethyl-2-hydroxymuconate isomerase